MTSSQHLKEAEKIIDNYKRPSSLFDDKDILLAICHVLISLTQEYKDRL